MHKLIVANPNKDVTALFLKKWNSKFSKEELQKVLNAYSFKEKIYFLNLDFGTKKIKPKTSGKKTFEQKITTMNLEDAISNTDLDTLQVEACVPDDGGGLNWPCDLQVYNDH